MLTAPVGSATPATIFPGIGLTCHFIAGVTSVNPELPGPRAVAKFVGTSINTSRQLFPNAIGYLCHHDLAAVLTSEIHTVLAPEAANGYNDAGVRYIRPVCRDFVLGGRTAFRLCVHHPEDSKRRQQTSLKSSFGYRPVEIVDSLIGAEAKRAQLQQREQLIAPRISLVP